MKKIIIALLIVGLSCQSLKATDTKPNPPQVSAEVKAEMNKALPQTTHKITTGDWIWISVFVIVAVIGGSVAYNTKKPI
jgi:hypothetical protein